MACATHFAVWEKTQYRFMHEASREWLEHGTFRGTRGRALLGRPARGGVDRAVNRREGSGGG